MYVWFSLNVGPSCKSYIWLYYSEKSGNIPGISVPIYCMYKLEEVHTTFYCISFVQIEETESKPIYLYSKILLPRTCYNLFLVNGNM